MAFDIIHPDADAIECQIVDNVAQLLADSVARTPERVALEFFDHDITLTYTELFDQVRRVAAGLTARGVRKGTHVGMMLPNCVEFPVSWLAMAWVGAVCVQLNPRHTAAELDYVINDADMDFLILDETCLPAFETMTERPSRLPDEQVLVRCSADAGRHVDWRELLQADPLPAQVPPDLVQQDLLAMLYTSGSTGFPKGCLLDHRYWLQLAVSAIAVQCGHHPRHVLIYEPMFYMQGSFILLAALYANATIHCSARPSIKKLPDWIERFQIDYCAYPAPAVVGIENIPKEKGRSLEWVHAWYYHGDDIERLERHFDVVARDVFGMTENGLALYVPADRDDLSTPGCMGIPGPLREVRLVGDDGVDVGDGEVGELWTAGPGHLRGYYRKPKANAETFVGKWFRTGDLMRRDANGVYYLIGRIKDVVKRSGENIAAAEVEDCLCKLSGVVLAAVVAVPDEHRGEEVKAYVQLEDGLTNETLPPEQLLAHCVERLAPFKVPRYLSYVDEFPMTAGNDKVAKPKLTKGIDDLRLGAYDRIDDCWR